MPVTYRPRVGEAVGINDWMGEDEWEIDFEDTRGFTAERWATAKRLYKLEKADQSLVENVTNHDAFADYLKDTTNRTTNAFQLTSLQSISQIHRPLWQFEGLIKEYVEQRDLFVDTSSLWAMAYLNVKLSLESPNKLRRTTRWMTDLRRKIELFNRCVRQCDDQNSMRMEMSEVFSPLLGILHDSIAYLQRHNADEDFAKYWPTYMEPKIKDYLDSMENTVKHLQSIGATSKANQATSTKLVELGLRDRDQEKDGAEKALFPVETLPPYPRDCFVGREKEIENIRLRLNSTDPDRLRTYLIYGRRGIGKTQIALEYCERYRKDYDAIFWVRCETSASLRQSFADIAVALELDGADKNGHFEENLMKVLGWLKRTRKNWLLVYDNAERETLLKGYWPVGARGSILLTSRSFHNFFEDEKRYGETVPFFKEKESWDLLMALLGEKWQKEHLEESDMLVPLERIAAETLLERTKGLPLAITHAAKLVVNPKISKHKDIPDTSVRGFLELFSEAYKTLPPRPTGDRQQEFHALDTIWSIAFTALSENARAILGVLALLSPDVTLVDLFLPSDQSRLTGKLGFCRTGSGDLSNRPKLQAAMQPSVALLHAIDELNRAAFIGKAAREMRIHREVQEAVNYQGSEDLTDSFNAAVNLVYDAFPKQELGRPLTDQWDSCRRWVQECIHLANKYWLYKDKSRVPLEDQPWADLLADLLSNCAWYLFEIADYTECRNIVKIGCGTCTDKSSLIYAHLLNTQGAAYYELNQLAPCRDAFQAAIDIRTELLPPLHPELAISYANLGNVEAAKGNLTEALDWFQKAADIREQMPDTTATMLGLNYLQIGRVHFLKGDWERAYELYQRSEGIFNKRIGQNRSYTADLHYAYGNLEFAQKKFIEAARSYEQCRRISMDYNPLHPITSAASYKLACCAFEQDHHRKALNLLDRALEIAEIRSNGEIDGMCTRILWKKAEVLLDDPLANRRDEGHILKIEAELKHREIAEQLGISLRLNELADDVDREESFDLLVPGYFR